MKISTIFTATLITLTACTPTIYNRGHEVPAEKMPLLKIGETTKEEVSELIGSPSSVSPFNNKTWYYVYEKTEQISFLNPALIEGQIVSLHFDDHNKLLKIDVVDTKEREKLKKAKRETPTSGYSFGLLDQLLGNIGRFGGKDPDNDKPL